MRANTPPTSDLQRWVHATLLDSIPLTYELLVGPLTPRERDQYARSRDHGAAVGNARWLAPTRLGAARRVHARHAGEAAHRRGPHEPAARTVGPVPRAVARGLARVSGDTACHHRITSAINSRCLRLRMAPARREGVLPRVARALLADLAGDASSIRARVADGEASRSGAMTRRSWLHQR